MKILQVHTPYRQAGGEDTIAREEAALLREVGHDVALHHVPNPEGAVAAAKAFARAPWNRSAAQSVREAVRRTSPDVVHVYNTWFAQSPAILPAVHDMGVPVVMTVQNYRHMCVNSALFRDGNVCEDCVGTHPWRGVAHRCYRDSAAASAVVAATISVHRRRGTWERDVDVFLAPTPFARSRMIAAGLPGDRVQVKPNFVTDPGSRPAPPSRSSDVLFCGRLTAEKGVLALLDAWEAAGDTGLTLSIVGSGPLSAAIAARASQSVRMLGQQSPSATRDLMRSARALAFPSMWYEGQPLTILEGLAAGLPVLTSDLGGMADIAADLGTPWRLPPGDAQAWSAALQGLDDEIVDAGGSRARALYEERFTRERGLRGLEDAYRAAAGR